MIFSYLKMTWKVMLRNKFFTFISLFGISFTVMILMIVMAFIDLLIGDNYPERNRHRTLYVNGIFLSKEGKPPQRKIISAASYTFLSHHVLPMKTPEAISVFGTGIFSRIAGSKLQGFMLKYTDAQLWKIMDFKFVAGKPFTRQQVDKASKVAVISESMRDQYFGQERVIGKYIESGDTKYQVIGVVKNPPVGYSYADIWVPHTVDINKENENGLTGRYHAIILARDKADIPKIKSEYDNQLKKVAFSDPNQYDKIESWATTALESLIGLTHIGQFVAAFIFLACVFIAIPSINLININISRIMERSSEIGVRKAYGATSGSLVTQFVFENVILTIIGGILGFVIAIYAADLLVDLINTINPMFQIPYGQFQVNWRISMYCMLVSLLFGIISGVYPAYRMSRLHPVEALKGGEI